ncbi:MAG: DUF5011 domain-containing protein [Chitinispirillaceae bacterium]|nr:DUF5011 domain-containing protein [Chitinispirillaceae bacterium]
MKKVTVLTISLLTVLSQLHLHCNGGSTEIGNARSQITGSITDNGKKSDSAEVQLVARNFIPGGTTTDRVFSTRTDGNGSYRFNEVPEGTYYLNAAGAGKKLLRGPIGIEQEEVDLASDELKKTARLTMKIPEASNVNTMFLLGTTLSWNIEGDSVILDSIPSGTVEVIAYAQTGSVPYSLSSANSQSVTVEVNPADTTVAALDNTPPTLLTALSELPSAVARSDSLYTCMLSATDAENDPISFSLISGAPGMTLSANTETVTIVWPLTDTLLNAVYPVYVLLSDAGGASRTVQWNITLAEQRFILSGSIDTVSGTADTPYLFEIDSTTTASDAATCRFTWGDGDTTAWQPKIEAVHIWIDRGSFPVRYQIEHSSDGSLSEWSLPVYMITADTRDKTPPVITLSDDTVFVERNTAFVNPEAVAVDLVDGTITDRIVVAGVVNVDSAGTYTLTYTVTDAAGNVASTQLVVVVVDPGESDTIPPVITLLGPGTIFILDTVSTDILERTFKEPGYAATDNSNGDITDRVTVRKQKDSTSITIFYSVSDSAGNTCNTFRKISVVGPIPEIAITLLNADSTFQVPSEYGTWVEPGYTASSSTDGDITAQVAVDTSDLIDNIDKPGICYILYSVPFEGDNVARVIRRVEVIDEYISEPSPPVITLKGSNPDTVSLWMNPDDSEYIDPGATAIDAKDGDLTAKLSRTGTVDVNVPGTYALTYAVHDAEGNQTTAKRTIEVLTWAAYPETLIAYGVPAGQPLPDMNTTFNTVTGWGTGSPDLTGVSGLFFEWNLSGNDLSPLQVTTASGTDTLISRQILGTNEPAFLVQGSEIVGLDGPYYVRVEGTTMYWVSFERDVVIIWQE